jgi:hypothetical protein
MIEEIVDGKLNELSLLISNIYEMRNETDEMPSETLKVNLSLWL